MIVSMLICIFLIKTLQITQKIPIFALTFPFFDLLTQNHLRTFWNYGIKFY